MNKFNTVLTFFRQFEPGEFLTRGMYIDTMKNGEFGESLLDLYRCYLQRAGYIYDRDYYFRNRGVYYISKPIPQNLTLTQLLKQAYPEKYGKAKPIKKCIYQEHIASDKLALLTGLRKSTRSGFVKEIWRYIKQNQLQNKVNPRLIDCDDRLSEVMDGRYRVHMYDLVKMLDKQLTKIK